MRYTILIAVMILSAALATGCDSQSDRPIAPRGGVPQGNINIDSQVQFLRDVLKDDPGNAGAWIKLGNTTMDAGRYADAAEAYGKALEIDPTNVNVRVDRGVCFRRLGRSDMAVQEFKKALEYDPTHLYAHKNLGVVLGYDFRQYGEAADEFQKYLDLAPGAQDRAEVEKIIAEFRAAAQQQQ